MNVKDIETFFHEGEGYNPFLISDGWQVAQLNFLPGHEPENIKRVEVHLQTDEVFVLIKGKAVLITVVDPDGDFVTKCTAMETGVTYNIPAGVWHNIAMDKNAQMIIVEKNNTHQNDVTYRVLNEHERNTLKTAMENVLAKYDGDGELFQSFLNMDKK
jgi:ureidoglycolate hydrolase